ncbi:MAG: dienelactone hydrolase [SAR202 cluster bacterium]|nr:dienelactone hydrolase [SAR202 cluster bacterium]
MAVKTKRMAVQVPGSITVTAEYADAGAARDIVFAYAPGAGSNINDPFGVYAQEELARLDYSSIRFQFPYKEAGKSAPDRPPVLEATWRAVIRAVPTGKRVVIGGRSMGGRMASHVVAQGEKVAGLALFAYPLIAPGKTEARDGHLSAIKAPTLFCSGTKDTYATPEQLRAAAAQVPDSTVRLLDGADHGFKVLKSTGRTQTDVYREAAAALVEFMGKL